jgi:hypothetical protein
VNGTQSGQEVLNATDLLASLPALTLADARARVFEALTGVSPYELEEIALNREGRASTSSARLVLRNLSSLLSIRRTDAADILDVSQSRISRNDSVDLPILDRSFLVSDVFARVATVLGPDEAREWFKEPNPALGGAPPFRLLGTNYGGKKVENLITALLNGSFV